jgi:2-methylisocitrate lyase-like PEP mutase family enzyme
MTLGRLDGDVTRDEALAHAAAIAAGTELPVSADLENGFADTPDDVAETVRRAVDAGLAGCSIEDWSGSEIYDAGLARERVAAAVEAAAGRLVLTARCENLLHGRGFDDALARLISYAEEGAEVVYAPGITDSAQIKAVLDAVDRPVNVLLLAATPSVAELAELGVHRISIGGSFANVAVGALVAAAREFQQGTRQFLDTAAAGRAAFQAAC